jgi:class 3 adenylate cyclase
VDVNALVLFTDARGFTSWANNPEVFARLDRFSRAFTEALRRAFPEKRYFLKGLGDGAMIVRELKGEVDSAALLRETLPLLAQVEEEFARACVDFAHQIGHRANLNLGWGAVRGPVQRLNDPVDYVGPNVNKAARLCGIARPFGIVIDRDDFPDAPQSGDLQFFPQSRRLTGIVDEVDVWVTREIATGFLTREKLRTSPEVHIAGQCIDTSKRRGLRILIAKRAPWRRLFRGLYEGCGGQLEASETFMDGVRRHFRLEMNMDVKVLEDIHCFYVIREPEEKLIPGIRFLCERVGDEEPHSDNHSEVRWVSEKEFRSIPADQFVPGLKEQVIDLLARYKATLSR